MARTLLRTKKEIFANLPVIAPGIKDIVVLIDSKSSVARISIELPWWKWLGCGFIHFIYQKQLESAFLKLGLANVLYIIDVR